MRFFWRKREMSGAPLMVSVSGVRGIVGDNLHVYELVKYVVSYSEQMKGFHAHPTIILGRDSRVSGGWIVQLVSGILRSYGIDVVDIGLVATPTVQYMVIKLCAQGGMVVTSSHNPIEWNGLKFIGEDGLFFPPDRCKALFDLAAGMKEGQSHPPAYHQLGSYTVREDASQVHIDDLLALPAIKVGAIREKKFKVGLDTVNGAGGNIMPALLSQLGCQVVGINLACNGQFAHPPEPIPAHLSQLSHTVCAEGCDLGIAVDPDVDRCVLLDGRGRPIGEEYTLALAVYYAVVVLGRRGIVARNLSTSRALDDICSQHQCRVVATPVGEIHVAKRAVEEKAILAGEGNGGVMLPELHMGRDAPVAAALVLSLLAHEGCNLAEMLAKLPTYHITKDKAALGSKGPEAVLEALEKEAREAGHAVSTVDGLRIDSADWWVHLRRSNTEPVVRVIAEARTKAAADEVCQQYMNKIR